jgi:hypothetical protein
MNLKSFDAFERKYIFCMWPDANKMSEDRAAELFSILTNTICPVVFLTKESAKKWELADYPFHPALPYLSECHTSDYLRSYIIHHYGGGYSDIKFAFKAWDTAFDLLKESPAYILGPELSEPGLFGLSPKYKDTPLLEDFKKNYVPFGIPNAAFISKRQTPFTQDLYNRTIELLDNKFDELKSNPGKIPKDSFGMKNRDGSISKYPLDYVELGPELFHFSLYKFKDKVIHYDINPLHVYHLLDNSDDYYRSHKQLFLDTHLPLWPIKLE